MQTPVLVISTVTKSEGLLCVTEIFSSSVIKYHLRYYCQIPLPFVFFCFLCFFVLCDQKSVNNDLTD